MSATRPPYIQVDMLDRASSVTRASGVDDEKHGANGDAVELHDQNPTRTVGSLARTKYASTTSSSNEWFKNLRVGTVSAGLYALFIWSQKSCIWEHESVEPHEEHAAALAHPWLRTHPRRGAASTEQHLNETNRDGVGDRRVR